MKTNGIRSGLIAILEDMQAKYGYLPERELKKVSKTTGKSLVDIYGVATFYKKFSLKPMGKHRISACVGTACHVRNAPSIVEEFETKLQIKPGETTKDKEFTLECVNCLGACALGPIVVIDGHYFSKVQKKEVNSIIKKASDGFDQIEISSDERIFPLEVSCSRCNHSLMDSRHLIDGYPSIRVTISSKDKHGWLALSCLYGSNNVASEFEIQSESVLQMFCPHCHAELIGASDCPECSSKMVPMIVRGGGVVQICPKKGCKGHILDLSGTMVF